MSSRLPFIQFFPANWLAKTRSLSLAAKGAWIDILCALHSSSTRGTVTMPLVAWARLIGATVDQAEAVISELSTMRVCDHVTAGNGDVTLSSRRMLRESLTREQIRERVAKHRLARGDAARNEACNNSGNALGNGEVTDIILEDRRHNIRKERGRFTPPTLAEARAEAEKRGMPPEEGDAFIDHHASAGWKIKGKPMVSWQHAMGTWHRNWQRFRAVSVPAPLFRPGTIPGEKHDE